MKFHCDRCKTRYSISDDRVRGKILKIRCKNCSAVITVREGMPQPDPTSTATPRAPEATAGNGTNGHGASRRAATRSADSQVIARRVISPTATDPGRRTGTGQTGARQRGATSNPALQGAFEKVLSSPSISPSESLPIAPPETYDVEWYVSIDGDQFGPYTLEEAQAWVRGKRADDELYCWSEGFDDWLLIDKVSHFRNLRAAPVESYMDEKTAIGAPDFEDYAAHMTTPAAAAPMPVRHSPAVPLVAAVSRAVSRTPQPQPREAFLPAKTPTPQPLFARTLEQVEANAATRVEEIIPGNGAKKNNDLIQMPPPEDTVEADLDLNISEASRVVKLPMFAQMALQDRAPVAPTNGSGASHAPAPALPGLAAGNIAGSQNKIGYGSGQFGILRAQTGAQIALGEIEAPRPELLLPKKRKLPLWIPVGVAAAVLALVVTLLIVLAVGGDDHEAPIARTGSGSSELAKSYSDPISKKMETAKEQVAAAAEERRASPGPRSGSGRRTRDPGGGAVATSRPAVGAGEVALGGDDAVVQGYLDPLEVTSAYRKYQINIKRCYETALKRDPFLVVPKTQVQISVAPGGSVTAVSIPSLSGSPLGNCLAGSIKKWKFKKSTKGLNTAFEVMFKS